MPRNIMDHIHFGKIVSRTSIVMLILLPFLLADSALSQRRTERPNRQRRLEKLEPDFAPAARAGR